MIPLIACGAAPPAGDGHSALVLVGGATPAPGYSIVRHAGAEAASRAGTCPCCRTPSGLAAVLRRLFLDRVRGTAEFDAVMIAGAATAAIDEAASDPIVAARFRRVS